MTLLRRNGGLLLTSFLISGLVNVHAQAFFAAHAPQAKERWLALALLTGTLVSIGAVGISKRRGFGSAPVLVGTALIALMLGASGLLFAVRWLWLYAALHVLVRGTANYVTQELDRRATALAGAEARARNDQLGSGLRFAGMLLGPVWLGMFGHSGWTTACVLAALGALGITGCVSVASAPAARPEVASAPLPPSERRIWIAAICIYGAYYLLASSAVYVLRDVHGRSDATRVGAALIGCVYASAIVSTVVIGLLTRRGLPRRWMFLAPCAMAVAATTLATRAAGRLPVLFSGGAVLGLAFALFLLSFREHVTARAAAGEPQWIAVFNNLGNHSALVGFGSMSVLVALGGVTSVSFAGRLSAGLVVLCAVALFAGARRPPAPVAVERAAAP